MPESTPPRRRISDRNYSSLERQLDLVNERVDDSADRLASVDRRISEVRTDLAQTNDRLTRIEKELRESFARNFREHRAVQDTAEEIKQTVTPSRVDYALKVATIVSFLLIPILAAYVAAGH